jgi:hypothetical protein
MRGIGAGPTGAPAIVGRAGSSSASSAEKKIWVACSWISSWPPALALPGSNGDVVIVVASPESSSSSSSSLGGGLAAMAGRGGGAAGGGGARRRSLRLRRADLGERVEALLLLGHLGSERRAHPRRELRGAERRALPRDEALQGLLHLGGALPSVLHVASERLHDDVLELLRDVGDLQRQRGHLCVAHLLQRREVALSHEQPLGREHLVETRADGEDVGAMIDGQATHLLGAHVAELPLEHARLRLGVSGRCLRDAEIDHLHLALVGHQAVLRAHVAMDDSERPTAAVLLAVRVVEPLTHLGADPRAHRGGHLLPHLPEAVHDLEQVFAPDVLHRDVVRVGDLPELVDRNDVRVRQLPGDLRLVDEHLDEIFILRHRRQDPLDRQDLLEALHAERLRRVDLRHATDRDAVDEQVLAERDHSVGALAVGTL